jgi:hypothetical protein
VMNREIGTTLSVLLRKGRGALRGRLPVAARCPSSSPARGRPVYLSEGS